ncbi:MAG: anti-sigma factor antagonist [Nitrospirae bacterium]|nr:MAG: anti-sigma factor antagonist [Nitrospirota bacterium]
MGKAMEVIVRTPPGATVIDLHGRLDYMARWDLKAVLQQCCMTEREHVILNLRGLSFIDSAGLGFLVLTYLQFTGLHRRMSWVQPQKQVHALIERLGLPAMIPVFATEQEALRHS